MDNPGVYELANLQITAPRALSLLTPRAGLSGMSAVSLEAGFAYGSAGTTCSAIVATSFDGSNWRHIARFEFTTSAAVKLANLQGMAARGISSYLDLTIEGVNDGFLGDRLALLLLSTGTYVNTNLSVRAAVR